MASTFHETEISLAGLMVCYQTVVCVCVFFFCSKVARYKLIDILCTGDCSDWALVSSIRWRLGSIIHCLFSNHKGLGTNLEIMGLATIDPHSHKVQTNSVRMWYICLLILKFLSRCISVKTSLINTKLSNLVNLGVLFLTMCINSC